MSGKYKISRIETQYRLEEKAKDLKDLSEFLGLSMDSVYKRFDTGFAKSEIIAILEYLNDPNKYSAISVTEQKLKIAYIRLN